MLHNALRVSLDVDGAAPLSSSKSILGSEGGVAVWLSLFNLPVLRWAHRTNLEDLHVG